jgi:hypothetical protein
MKFAAFLCLVSFVSTVNGRSVESAETGAAEAKLIEMPNVKMPSMGQEMVDFINNDDSIPFMVQINMFTI